MNRQQRRAQAAQARHVLRAADAPPPPASSNGAGETAATNEILIYGEIGFSWYGEFVTAQDVKEQLDAIDGDEVVVRVNSPGGDAFEGLAIYNILRDSPKRVVVKVDGAAISSASVIAMVGDEIRMAENALMMIHDPWTFAMGDAAEMRETADVLDKVAEVLAITYDRTSGGGRDAMRALMRDETWMTAEEALAKGLCTAVDVKAKADDGEAVEALLPFHVAARYRRTPSNLKRAQAPATPIAASLRERFAASFRGLDLTNARLDAERRPTPNVSAAERPPQPTEDTDMSIKLINEALGLRVDASEASTLEALRAVQATAAEAKTYAAQNAKLVVERDESDKRTKAAERKAVELEVDALVGIKFAASERDDQVELALTNRALFDKMLAQRAPMTLLNKDPAGMGAPPEPPKLEHDPKNDPEPKNVVEHGHELAGLVNEAAAQG